MPKQSRRILILLALAVLAYLPALSLPFIADDYVLIPQTRAFAATGWDPLWHNPNLRTRTTYVMLTLFLDRTFGFNPFPFYAASIVLHCACVLLVYATCVWTRLNSSLTFWTACFFAVYEGHQEAVMWVAASNELLVFLFGVGAWLCWVRWFQGGNWKWHGAALALFLLALASKESAWIVPVLMAIPIVMDQPFSRRAWKGLAPFFAITMLFAAWILWDRIHGGHFDNRFSFSSEWLLVLFRSFARLLFVWGFIALAILAWARKRSDRPIIFTGLFWMAAGLAPYCFLTYMPQVPSRHTYLASAGLSLLAGTAAWRLQQNNRRVALAVFCAAVLSFNVEILWVKKMAQYRERAEPTELLKEAALMARGPVSVHCTPLNQVAAQYALEDAGGRGIFPQPDSAGTPHCFSIEYHDNTGKLIRIERQLEVQHHGAFY